MRILVMTTRRLKPENIERIRDVLALPGETQMAVVSLHRPAGRLPVARHLVVGVSLRPRREVRDVRVQRPRKLIRTGPRRAGRVADRLLKKVAPGKLRTDRRLMLASGSVWSAAVRHEFAHADLVIAHDPQATYAAWLLARRIPGPAVVFRAEGAVVKVAELAQQRAAAE